jgi:hypothetical protein
MATEATETKSASKHPDTKLINVIRDVIEAVFKEPDKYSDELVLECLQLKGPVELVMRPGVMKESLYKSLCGFIEGRWKLTRPMGYVILNSYERYLNAKTEAINERVQELSMPTSSYAHGPQREDHYGDHADDSWNRARGPRRGRGGRGRGRGYRGRDRGYRGRGDRGRRDHDGSWRDSDKTKAEDSNEQSVQTVPEVAKKPDDYDDDEAEEDDAAEVVPPTSTAKAPTQ